VLFLRDASRGEIASISPDERFATATVVVGVEMIPVARFASICRSEVDTSSGGAIHAGGVMAERNVQRPRASVDRQGNCTRNDREAEEKEHAGLVSEPEPPRLRKPMWSVAILNVSIHDNDGAWLWLR
jgi:hypothetical protein